MPFSYSSFISYRRNEPVDRYFANLKKILQPEISNVTNIKEVFYDKESIRWGVEWDDKIYSGIGGSFFFLPIWYYHYLNEDNLWCARELYHAIEVEKVIKAQLNEEDQKNFFFIFPLIYRGSANLLPHALSKKNVRSLVLYEVDIRNYKWTSRLQKFTQDVYDSLLEHFRIIENYKHINFQTLFENIKIPTDDEIIAWIKEQKKVIKQKEAENLPLLIKNAE